MNWKQKGIVIVLIVGAAISFGLFFQDFFSKNNTDPWLLIPGNAAVIVDVKHTDEMYKFISSKNEFWKSLLSVKAVKDLNTILESLDSISPEKNPLLKELFYSPLLLSIQPAADSSTFSYLISIPNNHLRKKENLHFLAEEVLNTSFEIEWYNKLGDGILIKRKGTENGAYVVVYNKVLLISSDVNLLNVIINKPLKNSLHFSNSSQFQKLKNTAGKNVNAHFYINYPSLYSVLPSLMNDNSTKSVKWMKNFASWSVLDLLIKNDKLLLNGYTAVDNSKQFLAKYSNSTPAESDIFSVLPYNTNFLLNFESSNFLDQKDSLSIAELSNKTGINIEGFFTSIGNEICLASSASSTSQMKENSWLIVKVKDKNAAIAYLDQLKTNKQTNSVNYRQNHVYKEVGLDNIVSELFGVPAWEVEKKWYTIYKDYAVFAASPAALNSYISLMELEKTLDKNDNFIAFSENISPYSNIAVLLKPNELTSFIQNQFPETDTKNDFLSTFLQSINMLSVQFSAAESYFYTSISANHIQNFQEEKPYLWKFSLEARAISDPFFVKDDVSKSFNILVQDELSTLYFINSEGKLIWKKRLDSSVLGSIHEIDNPKTNAKQLLFNTKEYIYMLDLNGETIQGFPVKLSPSATNGLTFCKTADSWIVLAQADKLIHAYTIEGKEVSEWKMPKSNENVEEDIVCIESENKKFFLATDVNEYSQLFNEKGSPIKLKKPIEKSPFSNFYKNNTNSKGEILTTNKQGKLTYISEKGKIQYTDFGNFSPKHYFLYEDFNGDKSTDFIFIDGKKLIVFNRFKKVLFSYTFKSEIKRLPVFQRIGDKQFILIIAPEKENSLYIFSDKGKVDVFSVLAGNAHFSIYLNTNNSLNLATCIDNSVYLYRLK